MNSFGRRVSKTAIDTAAELRQYARMMEDFDTAESRALVYDANEMARELEGLVPSILRFEGELKPALIAAQLAKDPM